MVEVNVKVEEPGQNNIHNNAFYAEEKLLRSELQAMRDCDPLTARHWIVRHYDPFLILILLPFYLCHYVLFIVFYSVFW